MKRLAWIYTAQVLVLVCRTENLQIFTSYNQVSRK